MNYRRVLPRYIRKLQEEIEEKAKSVGLDFFPIIFEVLSAEEMNEVAAYGGFPSRYPHWRFGMEYNKLKKSGTYGLHRIYEMVVNNNPTYAYLLEGNSLVEQKMVMAHVMAHGDFFKNNLFFEGTNRKMIDEMANHRTKVLSIMEKVGADTTEWFLDACLSVENLIDVTLGPAKLTPASSKGLLAKDKEEEKEKEKVGWEEREVETGRKEYMESFLGAARDKKKEKLQGEEPEVETPSGILPSPTRDVLGFLLMHAPLKDWEQTLLDIVRSEAYYFAPQRQTKIMNEGWATYWHSKLMTEKLVDTSEIIDYADRASSILAPAGVGVNPYKLGVELFRHIEERWNKGRFGKEWDDCHDAAARSSWDTGAGLGLKKIFEVRKVYNDITFIDEFLTEEFCREQRLFVFGFNEKKRRYEIESREFREIKKHLLFSLTNLGNPVIEVVDSNYGNRGQLLLRHCHEGVDLRQDWANDTLANLYKIWKRPVLISTVVAQVPMIMLFDGKEHTKITTKYYSWGMETKVVR